MNYDRRQRIIEAALLKLVEDKQAKLTSIMLPGDGKEPPYQKLFFKIRCE